MAGTGTSHARQRLAALAPRFIDGTCTLKVLFSDDPGRAGRYSITLPRLHFDYSKHLLDPDVMGALLELAAACRVAAGIQAMFDGAEINPTEHRQALHVVLRGHAVAGLDRASHAVLERMEEFVARVRGGDWQGFDGRAIRDVINIGIGGSHLGPAMVMRALRACQDDCLRVHFLSNVDPAAAQELLRSVNPATTLFVVASKTFTTLETLQNAQLARDWLLNAGARNEQLGQHFVAVSSNVTAAEKFGILPDNVFPVWEWVGGRYSLWSAIGLPIALGLGMAHFRALLSGAHAADEHFRNADLAENIPVLMGLLNIWYSDFLGAASQVILPYSQHLELFPAFLQQLCMESLGKSVDLDGKSVASNTGMVVWGAVGTDGQHSFHQLLHQGTRLIPADFIALARGVYPGHETQHHHLLANCFSQSQALMDGKTREQALDELRAAGMNQQEAEWLAPHKAIPGNRPSTTLLLDSLDPYTLGFLTALYEHSVYVQSLIWNINAFDQWGVELGKKLSGSLFTALDTATDQPSFDSSTNALLKLTRSRSHD